MSAAVGEEPRHEIVIVRRGHGDDHDDHHGGVWKIAFADFMTAMMCFFLVMWLINAANEQTKAAVASYFNPVKLVDRNASRKGLDELTEGPATSGASEPAQPTVDVGAEGQGEAKDKQASEEARNEQKSDRRLFDNPYAVLAEIAQQTDTLQNLSAKGDGGAQLAGPASGASGGDAYRDPFAPDFWSQQVAAADTAEANSAKSGEGGATPNDDPSVALAPPAEPQPAEKPAPAAQAEQPHEPADAAPSKAALETAAAIRKELAAAFRPGEKMADGIDVVATDKGVTISVTDQLDFGMFEIGSALPRREMVLAMEKIGDILKKRGGALTIGGHTDARPFRGATYDNWRLSSARAQAAYYMLVRAGLNEKRVTEIAGFADRKLKVPADSYAAANRRIEILLEVGG
ncbi:MAG: MotB family protein [Rhizobiaceae bacterium]